MSSHTGDFILWGEIYTIFRNRQRKDHRPARQEVQCARCRTLNPLTGLLLTFETRDARNSRYPFSDGWMSPLSGHFDGNEVSKTEWTEKSVGRNVSHRQIPRFTLHPPPFPRLGMTKGGCHFDWSQASTPLLSLVPDRQKNTQDVHSSTHH